MPTAIEIVDHHIETPPKSLQEGMRALREIRLALYSSPTATATAAAGATTMLIPSLPPNPTPAQIMYGFHKAQGAERRAIFEKYRAELQQATAGLTGAQRTQAYLAIKNVEQEARK